MYSEYHENIKIGILKIKEFVQINYNGKCLSKIYKNSKTNLLFQCKYNHEWMATWSNIKKGKWCPECSTFSGERIVKLYFEKIFDCKFTKIKPNWLLAPTGFKMELDGFNEDLKIAFEHQGMQHYIINEFSNTIEKLNKIKKYDLLKKEICIKNNIKLFIIPQVPNITAIDDLINVIKSQCDYYNIVINKDIFNLNINLELEPISFEYLKRYKDIAISHGGECLSNLYINSGTKLKFRCREYHIFEAIPDNIFQGHWCKICGGKAARSKQLKKKKNHEF